jgi:succinate dehydrogenase/fumarate reductase flavoprotein subunit
MANLEDLGEVISTDVLVVGGGIGGSIAAIMAKESPVSVLVVEKATVGWSGKAPKGAGVLWVMTPENDLDTFAKYLVTKIGHYLNDQELLYSFARETYGAMDKLVEWGVKVMMDDKGKVSAFKHPVGPWSLAGVDVDMLLPLRARLRKMGVKIMNKVEVISLLKQDDRVVGAVGFNIIDGRFYIFRAKATILANGGGSYNTLSMWRAACGEGITAAYRAGAEMRNAEFANNCGVMRKGIASQADFSSLFNAKGENISQRYLPDDEPDVGSKLIVGLEKEVMEGRGPIHEEMVERRGGRFGGMMRWDRPKMASIWGRQAAKTAKYGASSPNPEVIPVPHHELTPIKVDHSMKTTLNGLWAIGDTSYEGSAWAGAVYAPPGRLRGSGLMNAMLGALRAGPAAARFATEAPSPEVSYAEVKGLKEEIFSPMRRDKGLSPADAIYSIQEVVVPIKYIIRRSKNRLEEAISKVKQIQQRLPELWAKDGHGLLRCHETRSMAVCAEMTFRAALMRTESRGEHIREDYPQRDDKNWLKWIVIKQKAGEMALSTEPIPIDRYKFKP